MNRVRLRSTPPVVMNLMIANAVLWLATWAAMTLRIPALDAMLGYLPLFPVESPWFHSWQVVTYMFMHGGFSHLLFNMFALWMFGRTLEYDLGSKRFLTYYMVCGIGAGLIQLLVGWLTGSAAATVGASGAIYGILLAFGMLHPNDRVVLILFPFFPIKAKWFVVIFGVLELFMGLGNSIFSFDNVAHFAHLGGMLWGFGLLWWWRKRGMISRY
ncbi:MAG: rhomboid family intramembrane serine protease [Alistipes sp.]|nr:rhomboid family intramembrane serine protease [Alistipes sp.]